jgi:hypothetical protein
MTILKSSISPVDSTVNKNSTTKNVFIPIDLNNEKIIDANDSHSSKSSDLLLIYEQDSISKDSTNFPNNLLSDSIGFELWMEQVSPTKSRLETHEGVLIKKSQADWMVGVGLFVLIMIAIIRFSFNKYLIRLVDSILNYQTSNNLFLEKNLRNIRGSIFLNALFFLNISFFAVLYYNFSSINTGKASSFLTFVYTLAGFLLLYFGKFIVVRIIGYIFDGVKESKEYLHTVFIYNKNLGIFLLPVTLSVPFIADFAIYFLLIIGLIIAIVFYLLRLIRGVKILFRKHVSIFYMILYLCALEILPLLVIYKLLKSLV